MTRSNRWALSFTDYLLYLSGKYWNVWDVAHNCGCSPDIVRRIPKYAYHPIADGDLNE